MLKDVLKKRKGKGVDLTIIMGAPKEGMLEKDDDMEESDDMEDSMEMSESSPMEVSEEEIKDLMEKEAKGGKLSLMERVKLDEYRSKEKEA